MVSMVLAAATKPVAEEACAGADVLADQTRPGDQQAGIEDEAEDVHPASPTVAARWLQASIDERAHVRPLRPSGSPPPRSCAPAGGGHGDGLLDSGRQGAEPPAAVAEG